MISAMQRQLAPVLIICLFVTLNVAIGALTVISVLHDGPVTDNVVSTLQTFVAVALGAAGPIVLHLISLSFATPDQAQTTTTTTTLKGVPDHGA